MNAEPIRKIIDSAPVYTVLKKPRPLPLSRPSSASEPFPASVLGEILEGAANGIQDRTQAPLAICAQSVLAAASLATQAHADIVLPTGHARPIGCYFLSVAASGERKSAVDYEALWPVAKREEALRAEYEKELPSYMDRTEAWESERKAILANKKIKARAERVAALNELGPKPETLLRGILTVSEPTFEGLAKLMIHNQPSIGLFSGEGGSFIGGHGMSDDNKLRTATGLSDLWDGVPLKRVRSGDGTSVIAGRRLCLHLMAQPDVASVMLGDRVLLDQGLLSRVLVSAPASTAGTRIWREPSPNSDIAVRRYGARLLDILEKPALMADGKNNELSPRKLQLSAIARKQWIGFADHVEGNVAPGGPMEPIRGLANKLPEHAARLAAVLALTADLHCGEVSERQMSAGITLAQYYAGEAHRLFEAGKIDPDLRLAQRVLEWMISEHREVFSLAMVYQRGPNAVRDAKTARKVMTILEEHGQIERASEGVGIDGVRVREAWALPVPEEI